jgi:hypothetical protein
MKYVVLKIFLISHRCKQSRKDRKAEDKTLLPPSFLAILS